MTRVRLRPAYGPEELARVYATPHDHRRFHDHLVRVDATIALGRWVHGDSGQPVADLSCGNATIATAIADGDPLYLGDFAPGYRYTGPIEETLHQLSRDLLGVDGVGTFVLSETLEHLDDPDTVLADIRRYARRLVLSTPIGEADDGNPEHYWGWGVDDVGEMLAAAGWEPFVRNDLTIYDYPYDFQIWGCR